MLVFLGVYVVCASVIVFVYLGLGDLPPHSSLNNVVMPTKGAQTITIELYGSKYVCVCGDWCDGGPWALC